jgi:hypothetical protein
MSNNRQTNEIDKLDTKNEFENYIKSLNLNEDEYFKVNTLLRMAFTKKKNNPEIIKENKQSLREELKIFIDNQKKVKEIKKKAIIENFNKDIKNTALKEKISELNDNPYRDNNDDILHSSRINNNKNIIKKSLNEKLPGIIASNIAVPSKGILKTAIDIYKWEQNKHEKMKEKEEKLKKRMENLADKIGKMHTYSTIGRMKTIQKYHPFYDELMYIEKLSDNIDKQEKSIQELEEKLGNVSVDKLNNQEIIKNYEKGNSILKKNIAVLEKKIAHLEEKINHSPKTVAIIKRITLRKTTRPSSIRTRSSKNLSQNTERILLARHGIRNNKVYPYPLIPNNTSNIWVKEDPIRKKGPFTNPRITYKAGKRTKKKNRKSRKL